MGAKDEDDRRRRTDGEGGGGGDDEDVMGRKRRDEHRAEAEAEPERREPERREAKRRETAEDSGRVVMHDNHLQPSIHPQIQISRDGVLITRAWVWSRVHRCGHE